jgi:hypothetical protein
MLDSSVSIKTGYRLESRGSIPGRDKEFSLFHSFHTGSEAYLASYTMGFGCFLTVINAAGTWN